MFNLIIERAEPKELPPATGMRGTTKSSAASIQAEDIGREANVWFGFGSPASQRVGASDCDELVEFFTQLAIELRRNTSNNLEQHERPCLNIA